MDIKANIIKTVRELALSEVLKAKSFKMLYSKEEAMDQITMMEYAYKYVKGYCYHSESHDYFNSLRKSVESLKDDDFPIIAAASKKKIDGESVQSLFRIYYNNNEAEDLYVGYYTIYKGVVFNQQKIPQIQVLFVDLLSESDMVPEYEFTPEVRVKPICDADVVTPYERKDIIKRAITNYNIISTENTAIKLDFIGKMPVNGTINSQLLNVNNQNEFKIMKCKQCNKLYLLTSDEIKWYRNNGLAIPKRCKDCRKSNRSTEA